MAHTLFLGGLAFSTSHECVRELSGRVGGKRGGSRW